MQEWKLRIMKKGRGLKKFVTRLLIAGRKSLLVACIFRRLARRRTHIGRMRIDGVKKVSLEREGSLTKPKVYPRQRGYVYKLRIPCKCEWVIKRKLVLESVELVFRHHPLIDLSFLLAISLFNREKQWRVSVMNFVMKKKNSILLMELLRVTGITGCHANKCISCK